LKETVGSDVIEDSRAVAGNQGDIFLFGLSSLVLGLVFVENRNEEALGGAKYGGREGDESYLGFVIGGTKSRCLEFLLSALRKKSHFLSFLIYF
jgi:hypothetical protein